MLQKTDVKYGADVFVEILRNFGVEYIFSSPGSEWPPLWEALAKQKELGLDGPQYYNFRHEDLAIGAAMGYTKATGKLAVCLIHASVGTLHAAMGIRAAYQEKCPILVCAGESVTFGEGDDAWVGAQWGRYLADYGGPARLVEPYTKSSFGLNHKAVMTGAIHRACQLAAAAPAGPVFLSLPFEYLKEEAVVPAPAANNLAAQPQVDETALQEAAALIAGAKNPLIITENIGQVPASVKELVKLAETLGAGVVESQQAGAVSFPRDHDLHAGYSPNAFLASADVVLCLDVISPWYPPMGAHPAGAKVINIGDDPLRARVPYHGIAADLNIVGDPHTALKKLLRMVTGKMRGKKQAADKRAKAWAKTNNGRRAQWRKVVDAQSNSSPIDTRWLCRVLDDTLPSNAILVNETILTNWTLTGTMEKLRPGQLMNGLSGGLGLGMGLALGAKVANPNRPVVTIVGDGTFNYNAPLPALGFCQEYGLPTLTIVVNNGAYRSMKMGVEMLYPNGSAAKVDTYYGSSIAPSVDYAKMAETVDGYGETVTEPGEIEPAIKRALAAMKKGKPAILNIIVADEMQFLGPLLANVWKDPN